MNVNGWKLNTGRVGSSTYVHSKGRCQIEWSLALQAEFMLVVGEQVNLQVLLVLEVLLLASFAVQTVVLVVVLAHVFPQSHGEGHGFPATLVVANGLESVVRHHL